jgi:hypothetical protein
MHQNSLGQSRSTLKMETQQDSETLVFNSTFMQLIAQEDFTASLAGFRGAGKVAAVPKLWTVKLLRQRYEQFNISLVVVHQYRLLPADFSPPRPGFASRLFHVGSVVGKVALGQVFLRVLRFSPVSIIPPLLHIHSCYHLEDGQSAR